MGATTMMAFAVASTVAAAAIFTTAPVVAAGQGVHTSDFGTPVGDNTNSLSVGPSGPLLVEDGRTFEKLARFNRERIPERVVHARGVGAIGEFEALSDESALTAAGFLGGAGRKTEVFTRFSNVVPPRGSPEALRDVRGFSVKFRIPTRYGGGIWDLVGNSLDVFFIRDQITFPDLVHAVNFDPVLNVPNPNRAFDFFGALRGAATNMLTTLYSDLGLPANHRTMNGHSVHAYEFVNARGKRSLVQFQWLSAQGIVNMSNEQAAAVRAEDFSHATRDLYDAINAGRFPKWDLQIQVLPQELLKPGRLPFNPLDATKFWPADIAPFRTIGRMTLNKVPGNFYQQTEQVAFSPANFLPGSVEPSDDALLQGRLVSYADTQRYRLGNAYATLPVNRPVSPVRNYAQDGPLDTGSTTGDFNYGLSLVNEIFETPDSARFARRRVCGVVAQAPIEVTANFLQAGQRYESFSDSDKDNLISNLAADLGAVTSDLVRNTMCSHFYLANVEYGRRVAAAVNCNMREVVRIAATLDTGLPDGFDEAGVPKGGAAGAKVGAKLEKKGGKMAGAYET